jgi:lipid-binding SYLF domain-containing protein
MPAPWSKLHGDRFGETLMPSRFRTLQIAALAALGLAATSMASAQARLEARMLVATQVLDELQRQPDQAIPQRLMQRAYGVAVFPDVDKVAFIVGGRRGSGVMSVRDSTGKFSSPVFVDITGGGVGWQAGYQKSDIVLVFTTPRGVEQFNNGTVTLGGNASVAAGPVGRAGEAAVGIDAEVLSYSRNRGLFAGVSLDGTALMMDNRENRLFYGRDDITAADIIAGKVKREDSESVRRFLASLGVATGDKAPPPPHSAPVPAGTDSTPPGPAGVPAPPQAGEGAITFPMEDTAPGSEPPQ